MGNPPNLGWLVGGRQGLGKPTAPPPAGPFCVKGRDDDARTIRRGGEEEGLPRWLDARVRVRRPPPRLTRPPGGNTMKRELAELKDSDESSNKQFHFRDYGE